MTDTEATDNQDIPLLESAEGEEEQGALDGHAQALLYLLRLYTLSQRTADVELSAFASFVRTNVPRFLAKFPQLGGFAQHTESQVATYVRVLVERGLCTADPSGGDIRTIHFPQYYTELIQKAYRELAAHPDSPFPDEEQLGTEVPAALVTDVNVKTDFVAAIGEIRPDRTTILRLSFPESIHPIIITSDLMQNKLLELTVLKIRQFLSLRNNAGYVTHRLNTVLRGHEHALKDIVNAVITKPGKAVGTLLEPSDFSFRFWAHFANLILQEFRERTDKLAEEHSYCQAAYLVGFYNVNFRGRQQKATEKETLVKRFETQFRKYPYAYTLKDLYALRDENGMPLVRKNTKDAFTEFLEGKMTRDNLKGLPEIVHLRTVDNKDYYIHRELIVPLFVKIMHEKTQELREYYVEEWVQTLRDNRRVPAMNADLEFERDLELIVKNRHSFFYSLLNYNLLFLAKEMTNLNYDMAKSMDQVLDSKKGTLHPIAHLLGLQRKDLMDSVKLRVPLFQRFSLFKNLFYLIQRLFRGLKKAMRQPGAGGKVVESESGREAAQRPATVIRGKAADDRSAAGSVRDAGPSAGSTTLRPSSAVQLAAYNKAVQNLKLELVGKERTIPESLKALMERWNPLYDSQARTELVEDVNAMIRDYVRSFKRTFRVSPPGVERIQGLAAKLSQNKSFDRITRKDVFVRYIEIYILKLLGDR